jgi:hypothetical protein
MQAKRPARSKSPRPDGCSESVAWFCPSARHFRSTPISERCQTGPVPVWCLISEVGKADAMSALPPDADLRISLKVRSLPGAVAWRKCYAFTTPALNLCGL